MGTAAIRLDSLTLVGMMEPETKRRCLITKDKVAVVPALASRAEGIVTVA